MERDWLPICPDFPERLKAIEAMENPVDQWKATTSTAKHKFDFAETIRLDRFARRVFTTVIQNGDLKVPTVRLALLSTSTTSHLVSGIRVAGLGRGMWLDVYEPDYDQIWQEINQPTSGLHIFCPNVIVFAFDAHHLLGGSADRLTDSCDDWLSSKVDEIRNLWGHARQIGNALVVQQLPLNILPRLMGQNEHRLAGSPAQKICLLTEELRVAAQQGGVDLVDIENWVMRDGLAAWHAPALWYRAKQEINPAIAPVYGDLVARVVSTRYGRTGKCLVLDLDNTLWGGVIGDDGINGIVLGQGSAEGEAFIAFQHYIKQLSQRGVILAVCSKNDDAVAREVFEKHPDMVLRMGDIACFVANWDDKAGNLHRIARELNIGLDALVFVDDNPFERNLIRQELPEVAVPEIGDEAALYPTTLSASGFLESVSVTDEDTKRSAQYQMNVQRNNLQQQTTNIEDYMKALNMKLKYGAFDAIGLQRIVQLINKTNQFNLTTRRVTEAEVQALMASPTVLTLQLRLLDKFGDNGIIAVVIGQFVISRKTLEIDTWLMSCRVLGRGVEQATLNLLADMAKERGADTLIGEYRPTDRNDMVRAHYEKLGFSLLSDENGVTCWSLSLKDFTPYSLPIETERLA